MKKEKFKIEYEFQMDEIKTDCRFKYDDDLGTNDLSVLKYILQLCNEPKDEESE